MNCHLLQLPQFYWNITLRNRDFFTQINTDFFSHKLHEFSRIILLKIRAFREIRGKNSNQVQHRAKA